MAQNIVHLVSSLMVGGAEKFVCGLAKQQASKGYSVTIVSFGQANDPFQIDLADTSIKIINIHGSLFARSLQLLHLRRFDIVHIHSPAVIRALMPVCLALIGKKCFYTIHGEVDPPQGMLKFSHQLALLYLTGISAVSESAKLSVVKRYGWHVKRVKVIANGVSLPSDSDLVNNNSEKLRLGVVSRFIPLKNIALLFSALASFPREVLQRFELHLFGDGPCRAELEVLATAQPDMLTRFYGNVSDDKAIYSSFDVLVMCSDSEGLPMSVIEAMGYAKPIIATDVGAISKVVHPAKTGWLYTPRDQQALQDILDVCLQEPELLKQYGQQAHSLVKNKYSIQAVELQFMDFYQGKLNG